MRVPFADTSTYLAPDGVSDEQLLMLADILPTGYEVGVLNGHVRPGDVVAVVGAGPIGLSAIMGARLYSPSHVVAIDLADSRLEAAKQFGADVTVNNGREDPLAVVRDLTGGLGADVAIEAVGVPATFELAAALVRPGGHVANIGVHGEPATLHLEELWIKNVTITTGLVDTYSTPTLLAPRAEPPGRRRPVRHPPLRPRPVRGGLRRVRPRRRDRRPQGRAHPELTSNARGRPRHRGRPRTPPRPTVRPRRTFGPCPRARWSGSLGVDPSKEHPCSRRSSSLSIWRPAGDRALPVVRALARLADVAVELVTVSSPLVADDIDSFELSRRATASGWPAHAYSVLHGDDVARGARRSRPRS